MNSHYLNFLQMLLSLRKCHCYRIENYYSKEFYRLTESGLEHYWNNNKLKHFLKRKKFFLKKYGPFWIIAKCHRLIFIEIVSINSKEMGWGSELLPGTLQLSFLSLETPVMEAAEAGGH